MATVRPRGTKWETIFKNKKLLGEKAIYFSHETEEDARRYVEQAEALLKQGIIPTGWFEAVKKKRIQTIGDVIRDYIVENSVKLSDASLLNVIYSRIGNVSLDVIDYEWISKWIAQMKAELNLAPGTIRHYVGALARCFDWGRNMGIPSLLTNPIRTLPKNYAQYTDKDAKQAKAFNEGHVKKSDHSRDRRLEADESARIDKVIDDWKPWDKTPRTALMRASYRLLKSIALQSCMRMREMYTLTNDQVGVGLKNNTYNLEKTKNGSKRQVPFASTTAETIAQFRLLVEKNNWQMFFSHPDALFPWWNGMLDETTLAKQTVLLSQKFGSFHAKAGCPDLTFHDYRHEATSLLFEKTTMSDFKIMKITGHSSTRLLARYSHLRGSDLAEEMY